MALCNLCDYGALIELLLALPSRNLSSRSVISLSEELSVLFTVRLVRSTPTSCELMGFVTALVLCFTLLHSVLGVTISHDQVQPFAQPEPVTTSEKAAVKYKPQLHIAKGCVPFPAVNAAGEITGGLKGTKGTSECTEAPLGSQVYGRSAWYQDKWAMMFAWYFPKNFWDEEPDRRHDWANMVLWLDNPALETPKLLGMSLGRQTLAPPTSFFFGSIGEQQTDPYIRMAEIPRSSFAGAQLISTERIGRFQYNYTFGGGSNTTIRVSRRDPDQSYWIGLTVSWEDGQSQDLIMWNQLTDQARASLNSADFEDTKVPFNDENFERALGKAYPF